jgi:hypothetical protein
MDRRFSSWRERVIAGAEIPSRIRYTRKSTEESDRQATSHEQQGLECDRKWGEIDSLWVWRDSFTGTTFDRPDFQDMVQFCKSNPRPRSNVGYIEMYAPSRFGRILDEDNRPDLNAYMMMYLDLERSGWQLRFVTIELTGNPMVDYVLIAVHATEAANYVTNLSKDVSRGKRNAAREGWWTHAIPPFGTLRFDTRANKVLQNGEASTAGAGGVILVADPTLIEAWEFAARTLLAGASFNAVGEALYDRGVRGRHGGSLGHSHVRSLLLNCALIGEVEYTELDSEGKPVRTRVKARWPALVDEHIYRLVETEIERRSENPRNKKRKARGWYPLRPICAHCGIEYNGTRLNKSQDETRSYAHPVPLKRANPGAFERYQASGCKAYSIVADELETAIRDIILSERASTDFEEEIRGYILDREEFRIAAQRSVEEARADVEAAKSKLDRMLRAVALASDGELEEAEFQKSVEPLKQDLKLAKRRLAEIEEMSSSREDAWANLEAILHETRNLATTWEVASPEERKILLDYWVLDVWIVVEPIEGKRRANHKTAVVSLTAAPGIGRQTPVGRQLASADAISSRTHWSGSIASRDTSMPPIDAITDGSLAPFSAIRPRAHAAWPRTNGSESANASASAGTASGAPQLPSATATLRSSPRRFALLIGEPRNLLENASGERASISISSTPSTPGLGNNDGSAVGVENLRLNGQTSWQMSQP